MINNYTYRDRLLLLSKSNQLQSKKTSTSSWQRTSSRCLISSALFRSLPTIVLIFYIIIMMTNLVKMLDQLSLLPILANQRDLRLEVGDQERVHLQQHLLLHHLHVVHMLWTELCFLLVVGRTLDHWFGSAMLIRDLIQTLSLGGLLVMTLVLRARLIRSFSLRTVANRGRL